MSERALPIRRVLASVTNKNGLELFAKRLNALSSPDWISSGGTCRLLKEHGINATSVEAYTGLSECFGGRVKTLHPKIAGGLLLRKGIDEGEGKKAGILPIDLLICNFYDFEKASQVEGSFDKLLESMDIGGPTLVRAACKNYRSTVVIIDPADYTAVADEIDAFGGITLITCQRLAAKAMDTVAEYDEKLASQFLLEFSGEKTEVMRLKSGKRLRYGENPDQEGWIFSHGEGALGKAAVLSGKEPSYNNYEDTAVAFSTVRDLSRFSSHSVAIVKHGSLCGCATKESLEGAFKRAWEGDPKSAFGSVIGIGCEVERSLIKQIEKKYIEVIVAPAFSDDFVSWCRETKPDLRLIEVDFSLDIGKLGKPIPGGLLLQTEKGKPSLEKMKNLLEGSGIATPNCSPLNDAGLYAFAVITVAHAKSNAISIVKQIEGGYQLLGMGAGQPNRIDCLEKLAVPKAREVLDGGDFSNCLLASDGFFPFDDSVCFAASAGLTHCVQPGGSKRDQEVMKTADELGVSMVLTGERYFSH